MSEWRSLVRARLQRSGLDAGQIEDVCDELTSHIERIFQDALARGLDQSAAEAAARDELTGVERNLRRARKSARQVPWRRLVGGLRQDLACGWRALRARPGFTAAALLTLALGIGANTAIFTVVHAVLLRSLPYPEPDRLVRVYETYRDVFTRGSVNPLHFDRWQRETSAFSHLVPFVWTSMTLSGSGDAAQVQTVRAPAELFEAVGVRPLAGRMYSVEEASGGAAVVVVSHGEWLARFGGDPNLIGREIVLDGASWRVVGIMPPQFRFPDVAQYWRPLHLSAKERTNRASWYLGVVGRLAPGVTMPQAQQQLDAVSARLAAEIPNRAQRGANVVGLHDDLTAGVTDGLRLLQGVVVLVLLIACANLANLQLAQVSGRLRELAVRAALGAHRARLARQLLTENVLLALLGGGLGILVALGGVPVLVALAPPGQLPAFADISLDGPTLWFTLGVSTGCGLLFGIGPALLFSRPNLVETLRLDGPNATGGRRGQRWLRSGLIAAEVTLAFTLLFGSALLVRSFQALTSLEAGFRTDRLLISTIMLPQRYHSAPAQTAFWDSLLDAVNRLPGVTGVVASTALPFSNWEWQTDFQLEATPDLAHDGSGIRVVSPRYFAQLGVPLSAGRDLTEADHAGADPVAVVNEAFVRAYAPGGSILGQRLRLERSGRWLTVVGVAADTRQASLLEAPGPQIYRPLAQSPAFMLVIALRTTSAPEGIAPALRDVVRGLDPQIALQGVRSMDTAIGRSVAERRFHMTLLVIFAALAAVLAVVGIYGVTSYVVNRRQREVGIRLALGASSAAVKQLLVGQGMRPVVVGLSAGALVAAAATRVIEHQLFDVTARDPATMAGTATLFLLAALIACLLPARRASRLNPLDTLRG